MIKTLKIFAIAILATGATVASTRAAAAKPAGTNVLQSVTTALTVYGEKTGVASAQFKTADLLTAVTNALTNKFSKKATLGIATVPAATNIVQTTNISGYT